MCHCNIHMHQTIHIIWNRTWFIGPRHFPPLLMCPLKALLWWTMVSVGTVLCFLSKPALRFSAICATVAPLWEWTTRARFHTTCCRFTACPFLDQPLRSLVSWVCLNGLIGQFIRAQDKNQAMKCKELSVDLHDKTVAGHTLLVGSLHTHIVDMNVMAILCFQWFILTVPFLGQDECESVDQKIQIHPMA